MKFWKIARSLTIAVGLLLSAVAVPTLGSVAHAEDKAKPQKYFFMLTKGPTDPARAFMAFGMAKMLAEQGHDVTLFCNLDAVRLLDKRQPLNLKYGVRENTVEDVYNGLIKAGGKFIACPNCSKVAGITAADLRKGAVMGNGKMVSKAINEAHKVINY